MSESTIDQQFIEYVVKSLVGNPDAVQVERTIDEKGVLLLLTVDPEDLGRVIGKRGATAQSLRTLLRALGTKNEARYNLKIVDNGAPREEREASRTQSSSSQNDDAQSQGGGSGWASESSTGVSDDNKSDDDSDESSDSSSVSDSEKSDESEDDAIARTRRELEDLDDLDI